MPTCSIAAVVDDHDLVGDLEGLLLVVGHEDGGHVDLVVQPAQPVAQLLADLGVEGAERLVEQQHRRLDRQRPGQRHPLPLAAGELARAAGRRNCARCTSSSSSSTRRAISAFGRLRISRPKATFLATVMCLNAA